ncbi:hypothetical protein LMH87_011422 [Akanthomyces muscarius]|uniref:Nucleotide-binding, alpha-beta plait n=3 Tax=Akanthomyces muscarius TaxID=2231603 RepID=A0A9W8Q9X3_AKAMU|nr:hypothetical protein LMH87_011422 [Akanthomyces muscarius]KAJ4150684.1 hypothetical protein LMH87_011422 [Akanthomyces muscarius]
MTTEAAEEPKNSRAASPEITGDGFVRLHITPFDADLLKIIVPATALPNARNISYHSLETFPEKRFGFVELPQMDADKIKKKLNGTVLKGSKVRVEKARPEKRIEAESADEAGETGKKSKGKKDGDDSERPKKRKREMGVVNGVKLDDRKVKRGWTEPADYKNKKKSKDSAKDTKSTEKDPKRKQSRSKYIEKEECLLKTRMPPNEMRNLPEEDASAKKKKKKGSSRQVTVHEFEKTTKFMNFLRPAAPETEGKPATDFIEGKGWVDEDGNVVEIVKEKEMPKPLPKKTPKKKQVAPVESESEDESTSDSDTSADDTSSEEESEDEPTEDAKKPKVKKVVADAKDESSGSDSSDSSSDGSEDDESDDESETPKPETNGEATSKPLMIDIPPPPATPKAVHPLEALYKRSNTGENDATTPGAKKEAGFSFFGGDGDEEEEEEEEAVGTAMPSVPMTPYTKQDFEWRNVRSAAPTPDTVHPARMRSFFPPADEDADMAEVGEEEEEEEGYDEEGEDAGLASGQQQATSDFQKWFWENRRDLNRSWMTRRKTAAKEKRHRDNKARASKAA